MSESKKGLKKDFLWNLIAEGISAGQSALILVFISACMSINDAGIFSIGYAISTIACVIGAYGVRNYQVTVYISGNTAITIQLYDPQGSSCYPHMYLEAG